MPRTPDPINDREIKIMRFLADYKAQKGYMPGLREIGKHIGVDSTSMVSYYLDRLERFKLITRAPKVARSICITPKGAQELGLEAKGV